MDCLTTSDATLLVRRCLESGKVSLGQHFRESLADDGLTILDAYAVLRTGAIHDAPEHDIKTGNWKYKMEGHDVDRNRLVVVFTFRSEKEAFLITIWTVEKQPARPKKKK